MGEIIFKFMSKDEVMEFKNFSKSKTSDSSPWSPKNDPELWMWRKTCLKQLSKMLPQNEALATAIAEDDKEADIKEYIQDQIRNQANRESTGSLNSLLGAKTEEQKEETIS